jgi:hypothetical protein
MQFGGAVRASKCLVATLSFKAFLGMKKQQMDSSDWIGKPALITRKCNLFPLLRSQQKILYYRKVVKIRKP